MKNINNPVFRNVLIADLSMIKGGRRYQSFLSEYHFNRSIPHHETITWWPAIFPVKYELHQVGKFDIECVE